MPMQSSSSSNERFYAKLVSLEVDKDMLEQLCLKLLSQTEMRQRAAVTEGTRHTAPLATRYCPLITPVHCIESNPHSAGPKRSP